MSTVDDLLTAYERLHGAGPEFGGDEEGNHGLTNHGPMGSATLNRALQEAGLIDRYYLLVFPVLLGKGKPLFSDADLPATTLKLTEHEVYANGIQKQVFDVVR